MCGFLYVSPFSGLSFSRVFDGVDSMAYRGSPGQVSVREVSGGVLAHTRLPIQTDPWDENPQPFHLTLPEPPSNRSDQLMCFVGEVFDPSVSDGTRTEDEYLRDAFLKWVQSRDPSGFLELDGFWAATFVRSYGTWIFTDHLGIKPVYYWEEAGLVCSEIDPMLKAASGRFPTPFDPTYLSNCIKWGYDYSGRTPYLGIRQLPPGSVLHISNFPGESWSVEQYWDWDCVPSVRPSGLRHLLETSCEARVLGLHSSEVSCPALLLSGGLDSSLVLYLIAQKPDLLERIEVFTTPNEEDEEFAFRALEGLSKAAQARISHHPLSNPPPNPGRSSEESVTSIMQCPMDLGSVIPQIQMAEAIHRAPQEVKVVLTGDGADEAFGGYRRSMVYDSQASDLFCELPYYHLPRLDRVHMRYTQEVRSPFLSPRVIASALNLPQQLRSDKRILREIAREVGVPSTIVQREKVPLKSKEVVSGGYEYRKGLVEAFTKPKKEQ